MTDDRFMHRVSSALVAGARWALIALAALGGASCGSSSDDSAAAAPPAPAPGGIERKGEALVFSGDEYTLQPGEEKYYCYAFDLPSDADTVVTKIAPTYGEATHHLLFARTMGKKEPNGFSECSVLFKTSWLPLYGGGVNSADLALPPGAGFRLDKGQQLLMQLHLQNASDKPIKARTSLTLTTVDPAAQVVPAGIFGIDNRVIKVPARGESTSAMTCQTDKELNVFAVLGHMHKHGSRLELSRGAKMGDEMLYQEDFRFDQQPITPFTTKVSKGDNLFLNCGWKNPSDQEIGYGESSNDEMCAAVLYYTPFDALDGCINEAQLVNGREPFAPARPGYGGGCCGREPFAPARPGHGGTACAGPFFSPIHGSAWLALRARGLKDGWRAHRPGLRYGLGA